MSTLLTVPDVQSRARLAGYDPDVLERSCVAIVGAGALGQNVAMNLALSGVGTLRVVDGDVFEDHNRSRSPLHPRRGGYDPADVLLKASSVGRELARIHVHDEARILVADTWIEELGYGAFAGVDAIAACVDSLQARGYLARVGLLLGIPVVDGGFSGPNLGMTVYPQAGEPPERTPCWSCAGAALSGAFSCEQYARFADSAGVVPAIQNGAATLGGMCAEAIVGVLHRWETTPRRVAFDLRTGSCSAFRPSPDPECSARHRRLPDPASVELSINSSVADAIAQLDGAEALFLNDVYVERANCPVPTCGVTCDVCAPSHRWQRDPRCEACGGPWRPAAEQIPSPDIIDPVLTAEDPHSGMSLSELGVRPGDIVEVEGGPHAAIRLSGEPRDLFVEITP